MNQNMFPSRLRPIAGALVAADTCAMRVSAFADWPIRTNRSATAGQEIRAISRRNIENAIEFDPRVVDSRGVRDEHHRRKSE